MAAEQPARKESVAVRRIAVAYVLASLAAVIIGQPIIPQIPGSDVGFLTGYWLLGPLSTLAHALDGRANTLFFLAVYAVETFLLAGTLLLWTLRSQPVRWFGYMAAASPVGGIWPFDGYGIYL